MSSVTLDTSWLSCKKSNNLFIMKMMTIRFKIYRNDGTKVEISNTTQFLLYLAMCITCSHDPSPAITTPPTHFLKNFIYRRQTADCSYLLIIVRTGEKSPV